MRGPLRHDAGEHAGVGILDWLEMGNPGSWQLKAAQINQGVSAFGPKGPITLVLPEQLIEQPGTFKKVTPGEPLATA